jgi:hypothetical protein
VIATRDFDTISHELGLVRFLESEHGDLYCVPVAPGAARTLVRRFNRALPPALIPAYARLAALAARPAADEREQLLVAILARSLLEPTAKTRYDTRGERFIVAELKPTRGELERWAARDGPPPA